MSVKFEFEKNMWKKMDTKKKLKSWFETEASCFDCSDHFDIFQLKYFDFCFRTTFDFRILFFKTKRFLFYCKFSLFSGPISSHCIITYPRSFPSISDFVFVHFLANVRSVASNILDQCKHWITDNTHIMVLRSHRHHHCQHHWTALQSTAQLQVMDPKESHFKLDKIFSSPNSVFIFGAFCGGWSSHAELPRIAGWKIQQPNHPWTKSKIP